MIWSAQSLLLKTLRALPGKTQAGDLSIPWLTNAVITQVITRAPFVFVFLCAATAIAQVTVSISSEFSTIHASGTLNLQRGKPQYVSLPSVNYGDSYQVTAFLRRGSATAFAADLTTDSGSGPLHLLWQKELIPASSRVGVVPWLSDRGALLWFVASTETADVDFKVYRIGTRPPEVLKRMSDYVALPIRGVEWGYYLLQLTVDIAPCGESNAVSTPNILICSELIVELADRGLTEALHPIVLHELAHSVLNLWKLPGYDNEDIADEFAVVWMGKDSKRYLTVLGDWLKRSDPLKEALVQILFGDRHTISVQRVRNMEAAFERYDDLVDRWSRALAPYKKQVTKIALPKGTVELATPVLLRGWLGGISGNCISYIRAGST